MPPPLTQGRLGGSKPPPYSPTKLCFASATCRGFYFRQLKTSLNYIDPPKTARITDALYVFVLFERTGIGSDRVARNRIARAQHAVYSILIEGKSPSV